jgi:hypothetical protein
MGSNSEEVDLSRRQFGNEQHVELFERHGVNDEEVRGEHAVCLRAEELRPGRSAPRRRSETMSAQDPTDRTGSNTDIKLSQLALETDASPASVLPTETNDEVNEFIVYRRTTRPRCVLHRRHLRLPASRCHWSGVPGVTMKDRHRFRGRSRLSAARIARSAGLYRTRP